MRHLSISIFLFTSLYVSVQSSVFVICEFYLYALLALFVINIVSTKTFTLYQVWILAFVYIILSEGFLSVAVDRPLSLDALKYLIHANNLFLFAYTLFFSTRSARPTASQRIYPKQATIFVMIGLIAFYTIDQLPKNLLVFAGGRTSVSELDVTIVTSIMTALGYFLPAFIAYFFKYNTQSKTFLVAFLLSAPIFVTLFVGGTRFPLLFAFIGFVLVWFDITTLTLRSLVKVGACVLLLFFSSNVMMQFRTFGIDDVRKTNSSFEYVTSKNPLVEASAKMSPEGVLDMTGLMMRYFKNHDHTYGVSTGFLTYFWIPRAVWPEKPQMLGYWLVREFRSGFSSGFSASLGFTGELYADFGRFSYIFIFALGGLLSRLERLKTIYWKSGGYQKILAAMFFPYVFFFVRSPITASITFLSICFFYFFFKFLLFNRVNCRHPA